MNSAEEKELIILAQAGDSDAENALIERFEGFHHQEAYRSGKPGDTDDRVQAARLGTLHAIRRFDVERKLGLATYVCTTSRWFVHNERSRDKTKGLEFTPIETEDAEETLPSDAPAPDRHSECRSLATHLTALVRDSKILDAVDREIYFRRLAAAEDEKESLEQIGQVVGLSREAIRKRELRLCEETLPVLFAEFR